MWKILNKLFGFQYVLLIHHDNKSVLRRAYKMAGGIYANSYLPDTRSKLLPGGKVRGPCYVHGWEPVTDEIAFLYKAE